MRKLKINDCISNIPKAELKYYLDKGYTFKHAHAPAPGQKILKDTAHSYPYRFKSIYGNDNLSGAWVGHDWIVIKLPKAMISFKRLLQCN